MTSGHSFNLTLIAFLLSGCAAVGPNFAPPVAETPAAWQSAPARETDPGALALTMAADPEPDWWNRFGDPKLSALIDRAARGNLDLKIAVQRIAEARQEQVSASAAGLPSVYATANFTQQKESLDQLRGQVGDAVPVKPTKAPQAFGLYGGALDASWELDLFGRVRRSVEAAKASTAAVIRDRDAALVSLQAEVAQTYIKLRAAQDSLATAKADISTERELLSLTSDRSRHGLTSDLDVKNALAQLSFSEAAAPVYEQQITLYMNSLAVLLGEQPGALDAELSEPKPIPLLRASALPVGLPSSLARRRPDILAAEARLHQQTAEVGVAIAALYPDITLTGDIGTQSTQLKSIGRSATSVFAFGPSITLPIFQGGRLRAGIAQARAEREEAALNYSKTVLAALQDVDDAIASYRTDHERLRSLQTAIDASQAAVDIATDRYKHGLATYLEVLTPENSLIQAKQQLIVAQLGVTTDLVTLYKSLGGGWRADSVSVATASATCAGNDSPCVQ